jgi:hypothetical protein
VVLKIEVICKGVIHVCRHVDSKLCMKLFKYYVFGVSNAHVWSCMNIWILEVMTQFSIQYFIHLGFHFLIILGIYSIFIRNNSFEELHVFSSATIVLSIT